MNENKVQSDKNLINSDQFIQDGFLKIPIKDLSTNLLINMIELLIRHIGSCKEVSVEDNFTGKEFTGQSTPMLTVTSSEEKRSIYEKQPGNSHMKNKARMCSFCRTKHVFGYMNCPMYGSQCSYCKGMNHSARACWIRYPEFYRFSKSNAQSRSKRNSMDLRKYHSSSNAYHDYIFY